MFQASGCTQIGGRYLEIAEADTAGGSGGIFGGTNLETTVASGTLTNAKGDLLWSNSKQGMQGVFHTGAGMQHIRCFCRFTLQPVAT